MSESKERELAHQLREALLTVNQTAMDCLKAGLRVEFFVLELSTTFGSSPVLEAKVLKEI